MATGEAVLFKSIWDETESQDRVSFITGHTLDDPHQMFTYYFAHCLGKGNYPKFRLYKRNIVLLNLNEHKLWDTARFKIRENPHLMELWKPMFELEKELIGKYYEVDRPQPI